jgi:hypothetical protein
MKRETKTRSLAIVIDFMNAEFSKSGKRDRWADYLLKSGLSLKQAQAIQETLLTAHRSGNIAPLADGVEQYANKEWAPTKDGRKFEQTLWNISGALRILYVSLVNVVNGEQFFSLKRCAECSRFFPDGQKRQYCSDACLRKHNSKTAQRRVEQARRMRRLREIRPKLVQLRQMGRTTALSEIVDRVPGFDPKLLALIIEDKEPLKELVSRVKYRNRKILMTAKLEVEE